MADRSLLPTTRNPLLALPATEAFHTLPIEARQALNGLLRDISKDARRRAELCWRKHKAPMAAYWKAVAVYARHAAIVTADRTHQ